MAKTPKQEATAIGMSVPLNPQTNLFSVEIDYAELERQFTVLSCSLQMVGYKAYSKIPAVVSLFTDGHLASAQIDGDALYVLVHKKAGKAVAKPGLRMVSAKTVPLTNLVEMLLRSGLPKWNLQGTLRGFSGTLPIVASVVEDSRVLSRIASEFKVVLEAPGQMSIMPVCRGFRTHPLAYGTKDARKADPSPTAPSDKSHCWLFKPTDGKSTRNYVELPGANLSQWHPGYLVLGASIGNGKEADLPWSLVKEEARGQSRAAVVENLVSAVASSELGKVLKLTPVHQEHQDRRIPDHSGKLSLASVTKEFWPRLRASVFAGRRVFLIDARIRGWPTEDKGPSSGKLKIGLERAAKILGYKDITFWSLRVELGRAVSPTGLEADVRRIVAAWNEQCTTDDLWICIVDPPEAIRFLPGRVDTKKILYREVLAGMAPRAIQSLCQSSVLAMKPPKGATKKPSEADDEGPAKKGKNGEESEFKEPATLKGVLAALALKAEILAGKTLVQRPWVDDALPYIFSSMLPGHIDETLVPHALWVEKTGEIGYKMCASKKELADLAASLKRRIVVSDDQDSRMLAGLEPLAIQRTGMRLMPPHGKLKGGWAITLGVSLWPELNCFTASKQQNWQNGVEKGIVLRKVSGGQPEDVERMARLCMDAHVRIGEIATMPAPFKMLREAAEIAWARGQ